MDLRTHYPFPLLRHGLVHTYPSLKKNARTDVAIIGAGITGALAAWHLQKLGIKCMVFDKRHVATGSTAASTSLIQYEIDVPMHVLAKMVGLENAVRSYERSRKAIYDLKKLSATVGDQDNFKDKCSLQLASYKKDVKELEIEYKLRTEYGFKADLLSSKEIKKQFQLDAPAALYSHEAAQLDAYSLTHKILYGLDKNECPVYDHTDIVSIQHHKNGIELLTGDGFRIKARKLIIACGYESGKYINKRIEELRSTFVIISEPLNKKELWKENCLIWETADPYLYIRTTEDNRVLVGGRDNGYKNIDGMLDQLPKKSLALKKDFEKLFPHHPIKIDFSWAGTFATTRDGLPYIGGIRNMPDTYFALGYGGNGITFSLIAAEMISSDLSGKKDPDWDLFSFDRAHGINF